MATFGELKTKVSTRLKDPSNTSVSASDVAAIINDAIQYWSKKEFWFNEFQETVTLVENDPSLPALATSYEYIFKQGGIVIDYAQTRWELRKISSDEYDRINVEGRGIPYAWCYRNGGIELYWYPDAAYSAIVRGIKSYEALSLDNESNDFTNEAYDLITYEALSRLYAEFRQDPNMESYYSARAQNEYQSLKQKTRRNVGTGRLNVECL